MAMYRGGWREYQRPTPSYVDYTIWRGKWDSDNEWQQIGTVEKGKINLLAQQGESFVNVRLENKYTKNHEYVVLSNTAIDGIKQRYEEKTGKKTTYETAIRAIIQEAITMNLIQQMIEFTLKAVSDIVTYNTIDKVS